MQNDRSVGLAFLGISLFTWFVLIPNYLEGTEQQIFPKVILALIIICSIWLIVFPSKTKNKKEHDANERIVKNKARLKTGFMAACYLGYLLLIPVLGFYFSSFIATAFFLYFLSVRKPAVLIGVPAGILITIYLGIEVGLRFAMPRGILF